VRRRLLIGAVAVLAVSLVSLEACGSGPVPTPFTLSYPAATAGGDPVPISLVDQTGLVTSLTLAPDAAAGSGVEAAPGSVNALLVSWEGGPCDDRETLVLNDIGGGRYELAIHDHPPITAGVSCDESTVLRAIEISFKQPLAPEQLTLNVTYP
jgi:hypothetical protein